MWLSQLHLAHAGLSNRKGKDMASVVVNGDTSGAVTLSAPAVAGTVTVTLPDASGTMLTSVSPGYNGFKNRIINGAMVIDQRNAGASVTPTNGQYIVDRFQATASQASKFSVQQNAGSVTPPAGFINYLGATSLSAYTVGAAETFALGQPIEGLNVADLSWGTASAATVTLSFWVRSSLTGTFGGSLRNSAVDRSYPFSYTISAANTWEQKSITIAGDTSGTWLTTNGIGIQLLIGLGSGSTRSGTAGAWASTNYTNATGATSVVGTNGATFYITGVQLEKGSTATSFDYRPYGTELALCQRYYVSNLIGSSECDLTAQNYMSARVVFPVTMRATPTFSNLAINASLNMNTGGAINTTQPTNGSVTVYSISTGSGHTYVYYSLNASAEL